MKKYLIILSLLSCLFLSAQKDTVQLYYDIDVYKLNKAQIDKLRSKLQKLNDSTNYNVTIESSTDYLGTTASNYILSEKRATHIQKIVAFNRPNMFNSFEIVNKGEISKSRQTYSDKEGEYQNRKTTIIFSKIMPVIIEKPIIISKKDSVSTESIEEVTVFNEYGEIKLGKKIVLNNLFFEIGTDKLKPYSFSTLIKLARFLKENPNIGIEIGGHVCCGADYRKPNPKNIEKLTGIELSTKRARFVYKYLVHKGIKNSRMTYFGYGFQLPIYYPEKTKKEMNANKRVEIEITKL